MIGIRRFSSGIFGLVFILALFGCISEVDVSEPMELRLAAWNIRIMSDKSRTDTELKQIAKTLADYDFIAIVELRDEAVLNRIQKILAQMGKTYHYQLSPAVGAVSKNDMLFSISQVLSVLFDLENCIPMQWTVKTTLFAIRTGQRFKLAVLISLSSLCM